VNFADAQCFLSRDYGSPENPRTLIMQPSAMGHSMWLVVVHKGPKNSDYVTRPGKIVFEPGGRTIAKTITSYPLHGSDFVRHNTGLAGDDFTQLVSSASVSIMAGNKLHQSFALPQFSEALKVLEECRLDLLDGWGFSRELAARFKSGAEPVAGSLRKVFNSSDYPRTEINQTCPARCSRAFSSRLPERSAPVTSFAAAEASFWIRPPAESS
jgi:hypothetical protein